MKPLKIDGIIKMEIKVKLNGKLKSIYEGLALVEDWANQDEDEVILRIAQERNCHPEALKCMLKEVFESHSLRSKLYGEFHPYE